MGIYITPLTAPSAAALPVEMVERKGTGHPDTICDAIAEEFSRALSRHYLERFGLILHHNVDKGLLWGGAARPVFGGGEVAAPIELYLAGRATMEVEGAKVPVGEIARYAAHEWLRNNLRALDAERHVRIHCLVRPSSSSLVELFRRQRTSGKVFANDTSFGVGFAPFDDLECVVLEVEKYLNSAAAHAVCPAIGEDIKVMGVRHGNDIHLTIACAMISTQVADMRQYLAHKAQVARLALATARTVTAAPVEVEVNTADGDTPDSIYLTVTGTSAEAGDDGEVGRGNRANGLITPCRMMSMEAAAGKNPVNHVGKIYNLAAGRIARDLVHEVEEVTEAHCCIVSDIGKPIDEPRAVDLRVRLADGAALNALEPQIGAIVRGHLGALDTLWRDVISGALPVW